MVCSSFHGYIEEIPDIYVDNFEVIGKKAYFLSHCHEDHVQGLFTNRFLQYLKDSGTFIYMSEISATIVDVRSSGAHREYIKPLKLGSTLTTIKQNENVLKDLYINVSLIPAGHCFGSVMFLFSMPNKTILYTGDFRVNRNDISKYNQLHVNNEPINIDVMYLDTTFQDESHEDFPKRSDTVQYAIDEMKKWLDAKEEGMRRCIALHTSARYGYEFLYKEIYKRLKVKVNVCEDAWNLYSRFPDLRSVVTKNPDSAIHYCKDSSPNGNHKNCKINTENKRFLYAHFSAYMWNDVDINERMVSKNDNRLNVCFATHCSRNELRAFVSYFSPKKIVGFKKPFCIDLTENKEYDDVFVKSPPKKVVCRREGVRKLPKNVVKRMFED